MLITATEIIKQSWSLYLKSWKKIWIYLLLLLLPTLALSALGTLSLYLSVYFPSSTLVSNIVILVVLAASIVFALWVSIAFATALRDCFLTKETLEWKKGLSASSHLIWPTIYTSILVFLIVIGGTVLLIIPGIIFSVWYAFAVYAIIFENKKGRQALIFSKSLAVGRWWTMLWRLVMPGLLWGILGALVLYLLTSLLQLLPLSLLVYGVSERILNALINTILVPLTTGVTLILYFNAKENPVATTQQPLPDK